MKTKLKHFINVPLNDAEDTGRVDVKYMVWSPVQHSWIYPLKDWSWNRLNKKQQKFLLKQEVVKIGLRNDNKKYIALFLKDYGKERNRKLKVKVKL